MSVPEHQKQIALHLRLKFGDPVNVTTYRDNQGNRPVPIGAFGPPDLCFYSTIGQCDQEFELPEGRFEFTMIGSDSWLPNALASSIYWLKERSLEDWPLVCEDTIRQNVMSPFRHVGFLPSMYSLSLSLGSPVQWLLGVPLHDADLLHADDVILNKVSVLYPQWLTSRG